MKFRFSFFLFWITFFCVAQQGLRLRDSSSGEEVIKKDSAAAVQFLDSLAQNRYYLTKVLSVENTHAGTLIIYDKGKSFNTGYIKPDGELQQTFSWPEELYTKNIDSLRSTINSYFADQGYLFNRVKSDYDGMKNGAPLIHLSVEKNDRRTIDALVFKEYEKVPWRFRRNLELQYLGKPYQTNTLRRLQNELRNHPFVALIKGPETLFTKDSTQVFLTLQKKKSNTFDGIVGFGNDKNEKFTFNGSLNLQFRNVFNSFESIDIYWQRSPDRGQNFDLKTDVPYLFRSNVGGQLDVRIFRQDSTYANVKVIPSLYLLRGLKQKTGVRGIFETSAVLDSLYTQARDFSRAGVGIWYEYKVPSEVPLFINSTKITASGDWLLTSYAADDAKTSHQGNFSAHGEHIISLGTPHFLQLKAEGALLTSAQNAGRNELLRFGGWNSLRGFNEQSLFADTYLYGGAEYRYLANQDAFFDLFIQSGYLQNAALNLSTGLYSFGLGFNLKIPIGILNLQISNGNEFGNTLRFADTKIHWGVVSRF